MLNDNVGGALIFNNTVHYGNAFQGGLIEHLTVDHQGRQCYCGDYDCLECYCSKRALEQEAKLPLTDFFTKLHEPECPEALQQLWQSYLEHSRRRICNAVNVDFLAEIATQTKATKLAANRFEEYSPQYLLYI